MAVHPAGKKREMEKRVSDTMQPKYDIEVQLTGTDGNAFAIMGQVQRAIKHSVGEDGVFATYAEAEAAAKEFYAEATSGDYDHLLQTCIKTVHVQ